MSQVRARTTLRHLALQLLLVGLALILVNFYVAFRLRLRALSTATPQQSGPQEPDLTNSL
jgi:hypothetical protein